MHTYIHTWIHTYTYTQLFSCYDMKGRFVFQKRVYAW